MSRMEAGFLRETGDLLGFLDKAIELNLAANFSL